MIGGNRGHFWIQHSKKHKVYQKSSMQLKKNIFADLCYTYYFLIKEKSYYNRHINHNNIIT
jgi:hypothetical protein